MSTFRVVLTMGCGLVHIQFPQAATADDAIDIVVEQVTKSYHNLPKHMKDSAWVGHSFAELIKGK